MFVLEASELGSGGIREFVPSRLEDLRLADAVHWLCPLAHPDGVPIVPLGVKGNLMGRLVCRGGEWGGPVGNEMHALNSNWVGNPAVRLSQAIALLERQHRGRIRSGQRLATVGQPAKACTRALPQTRS